VTWWDAASGKKLEKESYTTQGFHLIDSQMFLKAEKVVSEKEGKTLRGNGRYATSAVIVSGNSQSKSRDQKKPVLWTEDGRRLFPAQRQAVGQDHAQCGRCG
jgi:hypothetical protein